MNNTIQEMKCPSCGGQVYFDTEGQEYAFCSHCGTQVFKEDTHFEQRVELEKHKVTENKNLAVEQMKHEEATQINDGKNAIVVGAFFVVAFIFLIVLHLITK